MSNALGDHSLVREIRSCYENHKGPIDKYCRNYTFCDICNMPRVRLFVNFFHLRYQPSMADELYSVTITPKRPVKSVGDCDDQLKRMTDFLRKQYHSVIGSPEIKSVAPDDESSLWPHIHAICYKQNGSIANDEAFDVREDKIETVDRKNVERILKHNSKCLPLSWFPQKIPNSNIPNFTELELTNTQKSDIKLFVDEWGERRSMGIFLGDFHYQELPEVWKNIYGSELKFLLRSFKLYQALPNTIFKASNFVKVASYHYLIMVLGFSKAKARKLIKVDNIRAFQKQIEKYRQEVVQLIYSIGTVKGDQGEKMSEVSPVAVELKYLAKTIMIKKPQGQDEETVYRAALEHIDGKALCESLSGFAKKAKIYKILKKLGLNSLEMRVLARCHEDNAMDLEKG